MIKKINITLYIKYIYLLLVIAWLVNQVNQHYRFNLVGHNRIVSEDTQNFFESITEISLSSFSAYILLNFDIENIFLKAFIVLFSLFYFLDGMLSTILILYKNNKNITILNEDFFYMEYYLTKFFTFGLFLTIYETIFKL
jgi:hypothetical protein